MGRNGPPNDREKDAVGQHFRRNGDAPCRLLALSSPPEAACLSIAGGRILSRMGTKSRETIYGASIRAAAERATEARKEADRFAVEAWNKRMLGFQGPAQPSPALGGALNAGFRYLEVSALAASRTRPLPSTSCGDRRQRQFTSLSDTCAAASAPKSGAIRTSAAIWWRCGRPRFRRLIRRRTGGRGRGESGQRGKTSFTMLRAGRWRCLEGGSSN